MSYATEYIANTLRAVRESKGFSQRELSAKSGVPQGHISKIENGAVDLRISSLVGLARVLDLELTLVPRKSVSAVQSIVRSSAGNTLPDGEAARQAQRELARIHKTIASLPKTASIAKDVAQLQRRLQELQRFKLARPDIEALRTVNKAVKAFRNNTKNLDAIRQALSQLQSMRNALTHSSDNVPKIKSMRPAYSLDEDDHG